MIARLNLFREAAVLLPALLLASGCEEMVEGTVGDTPGESEPTRGSSVPADLRGNAYLFAVTHGTCDGENWFAVPPGPMCRC